MELVANEGKNIEICVNNDTYLRYAIKTKFINTNDNYLEIIKNYVQDIYHDGDIVSISEKIISICQNRIIKREDIKISILAKILSTFASHPNTGIGVGEAIKMQYAINVAGAWKVLFASFISAVTKLIGIKGLFYQIVGQEVSGLDGFYGNVWNEYRDIGILLPENPTLVCNEIKDKLGISCMIVDANDLGQEILGKSKDIHIENDTLISMIKDNPAGQSTQKTPFILIRKKI